LFDYKLPERQHWYCGEELQEPNWMRIVSAVSFEEFRFRVLVTAVMRLIALRDRIAAYLSDVRPPARVAFPAQSVLIPSGDLTHARSLEAFLTTTQESPRASILILHGIGERIAYWHKAQQLLASHQIASLVFHYSGYGNSSGSITPANLRQDAAAAYAALQQLVALKHPPFILGLSLGTGIAVDAAPHLAPLPSGIILCQPFSSLRAAGAAACGTLGLLGYALRPLAHIVPDIYRTASKIHAVRSPLLIVHSDADELFPLAMAEQILEAAASDPNRPAKLAVPHGFAHNDAYLNPSLDYWRPIVSFVEELVGPDRAHE